MKELLVLDENADSLPNWRLHGYGIKRGVVEVAEHGRDLLADRFLDNADLGRIVVIGREWSMRPVGFGGGDAMYPLKVIPIIPNLRGIITLGIDAPGSKFEGNTHLDIILRHLTAPGNEPEPLVAAVGTGIYEDERTAYLNEYLSVLQGQYVEVEVVGPTMAIRSLK